MFLSRPHEKLENHIQNTMESFNMLNKKLNLDNIFNNIINKYTYNSVLGEYKDIIKELIIESIEFHDEGKKNPYFQKYIGNNEFKEYTLHSKLDKVHSNISACFYICKMYSKYVKTINIKNKIKNNKVQTSLLSIIIGLAYNISCHHGELQDIDKNTYLIKLFEFYKENKDKFEYIDIDENILEFISKKNYLTQDVDEFSNYMLFKFSYSLLVLCDFMAVYKFENNKTFELNRIYNKLQEKFIDKLNKNEVIKSIYTYKETKYFTSEINKYRSEMYLESEDSLLSNKDKNIFFLEAPTGSGKTITSLNLGLKLLDSNHDRIIQVANLNNISEQTYGSIKNIIGSNNKDVVLVNSTESIALSNDVLNCDKDYMDSQFLNYPYTLISHVKFFDILFGNKRKHNLMLPLLCNSIIILDEVQTYKNNLWKHLINSLNEFSEMLNIKVIIMSATLPKLDKLIENNKNTCELIENRIHYYDFFKKRFIPDFSLLHYKRKNTIEEILDKIDNVVSESDKNKGRILIQTLTTKTCEKLYSELKRYEDDGFLVFKMLGITNKENRNYIINKIQEKENDTYKNNKIILIGTQCVEAGIDIDMNIGFKDISIMDSDEQFAGRIERNFKGVGMVYYFDIDDGGFIYKSDYRTERNLSNSQEWRDIFINKEFDKFYERNFHWLINNEEDNYKNYKNNLKELQYKTIKNTMKLIDNNTYSFIFYCYFITDEDKITNSRDLLKEYVHIESDFNLKYSEKQIRLKQINKELSKFTYNINTFKFKNDICLENIKGYYIVENGQSYFDNVVDGKIDKKSSLNLELFCESIDLFI